MVDRPVVIDLSELYVSTGTARLDDLSNYEQSVLQRAGEGRDVVLTGQAPVWLYLRSAHALHGKARKLVYDSPVTGKVLIFDHTP